MPKPAIAWHNSERLKAFTIARLKEHQRLDQFVQGAYWEDDCGCYLGCLVHEDRPRQSVERLLGIERSVSHWLEAVFEGLPESDCAEWVIESAKAIPVGADLSKCQHHFGLWLPRSGLWTITDVNREAIERCRVLHERAVNGDIPTVRDRRAAARDASAAAVSESARASAWSAQAAASPAAAAARCTARASAARASPWNDIATKSLEIFAAAPVVDSDAQLNFDTTEELVSRGLYTA